MHDPLTQAFQIKYPWWKDRPWPKKLRYPADRYERKHNWEEIPEKARRRMSPHWPKGYREDFAVIWHKDPEKDGTDDSCGYSFPKLTKEHRDRLQGAAWGEEQHPHFICCTGKEFTGSITEAQSLYLGLAILVNRVLDLKFPFIRLEQWAAERVHMRDVSKYGGEFCFLPGYHTNNPSEHKGDRERLFFGVLCGVARDLLRVKRKWWQHPRWHVWHWRIQIRPVGAFKRWAFSRCCKCGKGFAWGYCVTTNDWNSTGPLWFRSEKNVYHSDCNQPKNPNANIQAASPEA